MPFWVQYTTNLSPMPSIVRHRSKVVGGLLPSCREQLAWAAASGHVAAATAARAATIRRGAGIAERGIASGALRVARNPRNSPAGAVKGGRGPRRGLQGSGLQLRPSHGEDRARCEGRAERGAQHSREGCPCQLHVGARPANSRMHVCPSPECAFVSRSRAAPSVTLHYQCVCPSLKGRAHAALGPRGPSLGPCAACA